MTIEELLSGGDLRSIGEVNQIVEAVLNNLKLFDELFKCLYSIDSVVRMRAADAIEKVTVLHPELLQKYKTKLIRDISIIEQQEVQWHFAQIIVRVNLTNKEVEQVVGILQKNLESTSSNIVKTFSIQAIYDLSLIHIDIQEVVREVLIRYKNDKSAAVRSRVKKLLG
jgi:HEAT repeat protein